MIKKLHQVETIEDAARAIMLSVVACCGDQIMLGGTTLTGDIPGFDLIFCPDGRELRLTVTIEPDDLDVRRKIEAEASAN